MPAKTVITVESLLKERADLIVALQNAQAWLKAVGTYSVAVSDHVGYCSFSYSRAEYHRAYEAIRLPLEEAERTPSPAVWGSDDDRALVTAHFEARAAAMRSLIDGMLSLLERLTAHCKVLSEKLEKGASNE